MFIGITKESKSLKNFKGKERDNEEIKCDEYLKESELYDIFESLKYEMWWDMYTMEDIEKTVE